MKTLNLLTSACRYCRYYKPEGRRGGMCQMLGAQVQGNWKACQLAIPTFESTWESIERIVLPNEKPELPASRPHVCTLDSSEVVVAEQTANSTSEWKRTKALLA